jgi:Group II intron, maturase-specific domain
LKSIKSLAESIINKNIKQNNTLRAQCIHCIGIKKIDQEINKLMLYWSLDPEWKPKIESISLTNQNLINHIYLLDKIQYTYHTSCLMYQTVIISKFIQKQYLLKKLQSFSFINNQISLLLIKENGVNYYSSLDKSINDNIIYKYTVLTLLYQILCVGLEWVGIRQIKSCLYNYSVYLPVVINPINIIFVIQNINILKNVQLVLKKFLYNLGLNVCINKINIINSQINIAYITFYNEFQKGTLRLKPKPHIEAIKELVRLVKNILYRKNKFGKIRAKTNLSLQKIISKINILLIQWYRYFQSITSKIYLSKITSIIDEVIYRWAKKKYKTNKINLIS